MFPFRRKKTDSDDDLSNPKELDSTEEVKKVRRKRKKKEPVKPWGKTERIVVFIFFILAPILSIGFFIRSRNSKTASPLLVPEPGIISNVILSGSFDTNDLNTRLTNEIQNLNNNYGIWVEALDGSFSLGINETNQFDGASLFKLPLMIGYYEEVDKGIIDPNTNYTLKYSDAEAGAGVLSAMPVGTVVTYHDIVEAMGKNSDNTAFQIISNVLSQNKETDVINELGMTNTDFINSITTPQDFGILFKKLQNGKIISNNSKNELLSFLENTDYESLIPGGVPHNIKVAHKYASDDNELNDAGIVYSAKPFILVVLSKGPNTNEANQEIQKIAKIVYNWENGVK